MCGINGIITRDDNREMSREAILRMNAAEYSRGPDDEGIVSLGNVFFGHRRLSIIDLSKNGHQPMQRGNLAITFNGEIYNFKELKEELRKKGIQFKTETDTELILALFELEGEKSFYRLRGMFAFGLWDTEKETCFLVRDRFGIKPLYYAESSRGVIFASSVKAIVASNFSSFTVDEDAKIGFLLFGSIPLPQTTYREIRAVPDGCFLKIHKETCVVRYADSLDFFTQKTNKEEPKPEETERVLSDSCKHHLLSDAPLGIFLSGGLDSSLIASLSAQFVSEPFRTISVSFEEKEFSEERYQKIVAAKIGSLHTDIRVTKRSFLDLLPDVFTAMDQPTIDGINSYFVSKAAKEAGLTVVLSGLGADELFLGYPNFHHANTISQLKFISFFSHIFRGGKFRKLSFLRVSSILGFYLTFRGIFTPEEVAKILGISELKVDQYILTTEQEVFGDKIKMLEKMNPIQLLSYLELKLYMQNQLLKDTDFMSMHHSLEVRVPFVDEYVAQYAGGLSPKVRLGDGSVNKPVLTRVAEKYLPQEIFDRKKMGFTFPFEKWLREEGIITGGEYWSQAWTKEILKKI